MDSTQPRAAKEAKLQKVDSALRTALGTTERTAALLERARLLDELGRDEEARLAYLQLLQRAPAHLDGLTRLGALLNKTGYRSAARTALAHAAAMHPRSAAAQANFATMLFDGDELGLARAHYLEALRLDPLLAQAHQGLAVLLLRAGERERALEHARLGYGGRAQAWPYRGGGTPIRLLVLRSALGHNVPIEPFIDDRVFAQTTLITEFFDAANGLPPHDLVFNAIGEADHCASALEAAERLVASSRAPIINAPSLVRKTQRAANAHRLRQIEGVTTARIETLSREALESPDAIARIETLGFRWPLLVRAPGFHSGEQFEKVESPAALPAALAALPASERALLLLEYLDIRGADGNHRKYRAMFIGGEILPLHLAISARWKVHYYTADMATNALHRAEDEAFLRDMPGVLGARAMASLVRVRDALGLDYGGVDFCLDASGEVVVFEANATMIILPPLEGAQWAYRAEPVARAQRAVREMLQRRAGREVL